MGTIEERAKEYAEKCHCQNTELGFIAGAQSEHELLTRWRDPKEELPEYVKVVEVKYKAFGKIMMSVAWRLGCSGSGEDAWYIDGTNRRIDHENIIGWREIHE